MFQLDSKFRTLFRLISWIDSQPGQIVAIEQKWFYVGLVRAQLSWIEMVYLFFNGMTDRGEKFVAFCNTYAIFDNFDVSQHLSLRIAIRSARYSKEAYSSEEAKRLLGIGGQ